MKFVLLLTVFVSNYSIANDLMALFPPPPKESSPGTFEYDHNQDAIIDRVVKKMGQTQTELLDRNQNKFFETKVISNAQNLFFQEIYTSTKDNGIYDQRKTFRSIKADQIEIATAILKNNKYEIISTDIETNSQEAKLPFSQ
jgi:hypothetical protein